MNRKILNIGFIGGSCDSAIGITHKIATQMDNNFKLVCGCFSTDAAVNKRTGTLWRIDENRLYANYKEMIRYEKEKIDAIIVLTPTPTHYDIIKDLIIARVPIICEKALVTSSQKAYELQNLIKKNNTFLRVTLNYTGYPMLRELKHQLSQGIIGKLQQIHIQMPQESYIRVDKDENFLIPQKWRQSDYEIPTLSLDLGVHLHNIISFISNETPQKVVAMQESFGSIKNVIDNTLVLAKYTNNLTCHIWFSKSVAGESNGLKVDVYGSKGRLKWVQMDPEHLVRFDNKGHQTIFNRSSTSTEVASDRSYNRFKSGHPSGFIEAFANYYNDLYKDLINYQNNKHIKNQYTFGIQDSLEGLILLEAISESAKSMKWKTL